MANETRWTPGPWMVESDINSNEAASDTTVLTADGAYTVARTGWSVGTEIQSDDEREANARLIASAPDLYAALEGLAKWNGTPLASKYVAQATSALARARGETP